MKKLTEREQKLANYIQSEINRLEKERRVDLENTAKDLKGNFNSALYTAKVQQIHDYYEPKVRELRDELNIVNNDVTITRLF